MSQRRRITQVTADPGERSRYGNPPTWTVVYACGHSTRKPHSADLSTKSMFLRKQADTYLIGTCGECSS